MARPTPQEQELIRRANGGERDAFETLFAEHKGWVLGLAMRLCGNHADALDVLQETFAYFFKKFPGFVLTTTVRGFLFPVVRNNAITVVRKRKKVVELAAERENKLAWYPGEMSGDLERMVQALAEPQRAVVLLRFGADLRLEEIAEALDIPLGTVKSRLHNALKTLREQQESE